jgi:hypothetical protein
VFWGRPSYFQFFLFTARCARVTEFAEIFFFISFQDLLKLLV